MNTRLLLASAMVAAVGLPALAFAGPAPGADLHGREVLRHRQGRRRTTAPRPATIRAPACRRSTPIRIRGSTCRPATATASSAATTRRCRPTDAERAVATMASEHRRRSPASVPASACGCRTSPRSRPPARTSGGSKSIRRISSPTRTPSELLDDDRRRLSDFGPHRRRLGRQRRRRRPRAPEARRAIWSTASIRSSSPAISPGRPTPANT